METKTEEEVINWEMYPDLRDSVSDGNGGKKKKKAKKVKLSRAKVEGLSDKQVESYLTQHRSGEINLHDSTVKWMKARKKIGW